jgi:hypothetical protein
MAGDWIKMRADLLTHPKVVRITSALKADRLRVVGGLMAVWCLFDAHSEDGRLDGYTPEALDGLIGWPGFSAAMASVGWIDIEPQALVTPRFCEHNGQSAKRRAQETEHKRMARAAEEVPESDADEKRSREEKRREEEPKGSRRATRLPTDWVPGDSGFAFAQQNGLANGRAQAELEKFRDWWAAQPGQKGVKLDWQATWRTWVRKATETQRGQRVTGDGNESIFRRGEA